jgi:hypothetical protein
MSYDIQYQNGFIFRWSFFSVIIIDVQKNWSTKKTKKTKEKLTQKTEPRWKSD